MRGHRTNANAPKAASELPAADELRIEITDSGIGISREQQEKLFHAFEQAEKGMSREYGGTGLGLVISRRIVELMGGTIWVESELGKGARFIFTIKARRCREEPSTWLRNKESVINDDINETPESSGADVSQAASAGMFEGKRMLVAEDIEINREILISLLENTGLMIDCAVNGKEAFDMVSASPEKYDIVFMDLQMPQMDGLEAARRIRDMETELCSVSSHQKSLPIIAMTANVFKDDIEKCLDAGMNDHISKPLDIDRVLGVLRKYLLSDGPGR